MVSVNLGTTEQHLRLISIASGNTSLGISGVLVRESKENILFTLPCSQLLALNQQILLKVEEEKINKSSSSSSPSTRLKIFISSPL